MRITKGELMTMAQSRNPDERKRAFKIFQTWVKSAPSLSFQDQLNATERHVLTQIFASKGLKADTRTPTPPPKPKTPTGPHIKPPRRSGPII